MKSSLRNNINVIVNLLKPTCFVHQQVYHHHHHVPEVLGVFPVP